MTFSGRHTAFQLKLSSSCTGRPSISRFSKSEAARDLAVPAETGPVYGKSGGAGCENERRPSQRRLSGDGQSAPFSRRAVLSTACSLTLGVATGQHGAAEALPLAPLGGFRSTGDKVRLSIEEVKEVLRHDLEEGQYFVTGELSPQIFDDNCRFADPTNDIKGLSRYLTALRILFDPVYSGVKLNSIEVVDDHTIQATWVLGGYLKFPWNPRVEPFDGQTVWTLSPETGLIVVQDQKWSKSAATALLESFTPTFGQPTKLV